MTYRRSEADRLLCDAQFLVRSSPTAVAALLPDARSPDALLAAQVYRTSALWRHDLDTPGRRQLLWLDAVRWGARDLSHAISAVTIPDEEADSWRVVWSTGSDVDARLRQVMKTGPVDCLAWAEVAGRPVVATVARGHPSYACERYTLHDCGAPGFFVWDLTDGRLMHSAPQVSGRCVAVTKLAGRPVAITGGEDSTVRMWDLTTGAQVGPALMGHRGKVLQVCAATSDGYAIAVTVDVHGDVLRWDLEAGRLLGPVRTRTPCFSISVEEHADRPLLVTGEDEGFEVWDLATGVQVAGHAVPDVGHAYAVQIVSAQDRAVVAVVSPSNWVWTLDLYTGEPVGEPLTALANRLPLATRGLWSRSGNRVSLAAVGGVLLLPGQWQVHLWNPLDELSTGLPLAGLTAQSVVAAAKGQQRGIAITSSALSDVVCVWDFDAPPLGDRLPGHKNRILIADITDGGPDPVVAAVDEGGVLGSRRLVDGVPLSERVDTGHERPNVVVCVDLDGEPVAFTGGGWASYPDTSLCRWDLSHGRESAPPIKAHSRMVSAAVLATVDGTRVLVSGGGGHDVRIWDLARGDLLYEFSQSEPGFATGIAVGPPGKDLFLAVSWNDGPITVWDLANKQALAVTPSHPMTDHEVVVGLVMIDGRPALVTIVSLESTETWGPKAVRLRDLDSRMQLGADISNGLSITAAVVMDHHGRPTMAIGRADATVQLTDLTTGEDLGPPLVTTGHVVRALRYTRDGRLLVAYGGDLALFEPASIGPPKVRSPLTAERRSP